MVILSRVGTPGWFRCEERPRQGGTLIKVVVVAGIAGGNHHLRTHCAASVATPLCTLRTTARVVLLNIDDPLDDPAGGLIGKDELQLIAMHSLFLHHRVTIDLASRTAQLLHRLGGAPLHRHRLPLA